MDDREFYRPGYGWTVRQPSRWGTGTDVDLIHVLPSGDHSTTCDTPSLVALHKVVTRELARRGEISEIVTADMPPGPYCGECGAEIPRDAASVEGPWHAQACSLYSENIS